MRNHFPFFPLLLLLALSVSCMHMHERFSLVTREYSLPTGPQTMSCSAIGATNRGSAVSVSTFEGTSFGVTMNVTHVNPGGGLVTGEIDIGDFGGLMRVYQQLNISCHSGHEPVILQDRTGLFYQQSEGFNLSVLVMRGYAGSRACAQGYVCVLRSTLSYNPLGGIHNDNDLTQFPVMELSHPTFPIE